MGNVSGSDIGKGQASIGRGLSTWNRFTAKIGAVFLVIVGIVLIILSFVPLASQTGTKCKYDQDCPSGNECDVINSRCNTAKKKNPVLAIVGLIMIGMAGLTVWYSNAMYNFAHESDENAQVAGLIGEVGLANSLFNRPSAGIQL